MISLWQTFWKSAKGENETAAMQRTIRIDAGRGEEQEISGRMTKRIAPRPTLEYTLIAHTHGRRAGMPIIRVQCDMNVGPNAINKGTKIRQRIAIWP